MRRGETMFAFGSSGRYCAAVVNGFGPRLQVAQIAAHFGISEGMFLFQVPDTLYF